jgi:hypothetical protein
MRSMVEGAQRVLHQHAPSVGSADTSPVLRGRIQVADGWLTDSRFRGNER